MPIDYKKYPITWNLIRERILERDNHCCKICKVKNHAIVFRGEYKGQEVFQTDDAKIYNTATGDFIEENAYALIEPSTGNPGQKAIKIVLTIAHLNHNVNDNRDDNLAALCQLHHLRHDKDQHKKTVRKTKEKKMKLQRLFTTTK